MQNKSSLVNFSIKGVSSPAKSLTVEGFANKAIVDRGGDLIPPEAWQLSEYKTNNILLFNHNQDLAIGTADVRVTEEGLVAKAKISKSNEAPIPYIRDMIREGVIKSFSVGFDPMNSDEKSEDGTHTILKQANLLELSIVTVPMNQASVFSVENVDKCISGWKTKSYHEARQDMLLMKGAFLATVVQDRFAELEKSTDFDRDSVTENIISEGEIDRKAFDEILAGNAGQVSEKFLEAISMNLDMDYDQLKSLNEKEPKAFPPTEEDEDDKEEEEEKSEENVDEKASDDEEEDEEEEEKSAVDLVCEKINEFMNEGKSQNDAIALAISALGTDATFSTEDYVKFIGSAEKHISEKNLDASSDLVENANVSNPTMDQMKAQTTLMAQNTGVLQALLDEIKGLRADFQTEKQSSETLANTDVQTDTDESKALDEKNIRVSNYEDALKKLEKSLSTC